MVLKSFYINVFIRVIFIVMSSIAFSIILQNLGRGYYYTTAGMLAFILLQAWLLIQHVNRTNSDLEKFFSSLNDNDSSISFSDNLNKRSLAGLRDKMNDFSASIQKIKIRNEKDRQFLQAVVDHVDIGLLSLNGYGGIEICNKAAKNFVRINTGDRLTSLKSKNEIYQAIDETRPGHDTLCKLKINNEVRSILIKASEIKSDEQLVKLISFEDITGELDKNELESWQKLIRILTHEIMNSISPVTSLTKVISGYFKNRENNQQLSPEKITGRIIQKTLEGLTTIEETGNGLLDFVNTYRSLASLPAPKYLKFRTDSLLDKCKVLMESTMPGNVRIQCRIHPRNLELTGDISQIEQILINLIKNAVESIPANRPGMIMLNAFEESGRILIKVEDNGTGIDSSIMENIFIPFYTTKKKGSGIGLSISRQIMQNHNGTISVESEAGKGSIFTLTFPEI